MEKSWNLQWKEAQHITATSVVKSKSELLEVPETPTKDPSADQCLKGMFWQLKGFWGCDQRCPPRHNSCPYFQLNLLELPEIKAMWLPTQNLHG